MRNDFPPIVPRHYPRDMEAPDYLALCGPASRRNGITKQSGIWGVTNDDSWVTLKSLSQLLELPLQIVKDFALKNGFNPTIEAGKTLRVEDGDGLEELLVEEGPPSGTRTIQKLLHLSQESANICIKLAEEHKILPVYTVDAVDYYSPDQVQKLRHLYDTLMLKRRRESMAKYDELRAKMKLEGEFLKNPVAPWTRQRNKNSRVAPAGYMNQRDVCDRVHVKYKDLQARMKSGFLRYIIVDGKRYINKEDVEKYVEYRAEKSKPKVALEG